MKKELKKQIKEVKSQYKGRLKALKEQYRAQKQALKYACTTEIMNIKEQDTDPSIMDKIADKITQPFKQLEYKKVDPAGHDADEAFKVIEKEVNKAHKKKSKGKELKPDTTAVLGMCQVALKEIETQKLGKHHKEVENVGRLIQELTQPAPAQ